MTEEKTAMEQQQAPVMAVETHGSGPEVVLFHGGMGCRKHWIRNISPLSEHYTVHALDHPAYGESAVVPRDMSGPDYLDLVYHTFVERFPGEAPLRFAGFSFWWCHCRQFGRAARQPGDASVLDFHGWLACEDLRPKTDPQLSVRWR
ncbi:alpha/beta fold hydrolase [Candidatus Entotheonella palauensis]|uniref:alpha/beta fold hydrolase n=1 Tax=Candidatus Entotheonella palauensis TaxID=93172 RepID=UPI0030B94E04